MQWLICEKGAAALWKYSLKVNYFITTCGPAQHWWNLAWGREKALQKVEEELVPSSILQLGLECERLLWAGIL